MEKQMTEQDAMLIVSNVCALYRGTLSEHADIQEAVRILSKLVSEGKPVVKDGE